MINLIKTSLEQKFDVPFSIERTFVSGYPALQIFPYNADDELFEVCVYVKDQIRIVLEIKPQKFARFSVMDMANASEEQKEIFVLYAKMLVQLNAKIEFSVNGFKQDVLSYHTWPEKWDTFSCRITKIPVESKGTAENSPELTVDWAGKAVGMFMSLLNVVPLEEQSFDEGAVTSVKIKRYERNKVNRELCLAANGYTCAICGFNFEKKYGLLGRNFIHVHHIVPLSQMGGSYKLNPITDLIPVCPNCHAMLHRNNPPLTPEELKEILKENER